MRSAPGTLRSTPALLMVGLLLLGMLLAEAPSPDAGAGPRILFIRGGSASGGFLEGGSDEQLSDLRNLGQQPGNHGWGELAVLLRREGFQLELRIEGPGRQPVHLFDLHRFDVVVFGSNNASYTPEQADALAAWVQQGGSALFISDANWGRDWADAPSSDQRFLDRFGLRMNQDRGTYMVPRSRFLRPEHPILSGVQAFDGEGVSPITVVEHPSLDGRVTILAPALGNVRRNRPESPIEPAGPQDAALVIVEAGQGRVAAHFDRNTFFNRNGAGTSLHRHDNARLARNLFHWLAGASSHQTERVYDTARLPR